MVERVYDGRTFASAIRVVSCANDAAEDAPTAASLDVVSRQLEALIGDSARALYGKCSAANHTVRA